MILSYEIVDYSLNSNKGRNFFFPGKVMCINEDKWYQFDLYVYVGFREFDLKLTTLENLQVENFIEIIWSSISIYAETMPQFVVAGFLLRQSLLL